MTTRTATSTLHDTASIPVQARIAAAWTSFVFLYAYVDILSFYKPGVIRSIADGLVWEFEVSGALLTGFLVSVSIPAVMVVLSMTAPVRVNRAVNIVVASLYIPFSLVNILGETGEWLAFYGVAIGVEGLLLVFILRSAVSWPRKRIAAEPGRF